MKTNVILILHSNCRVSGANTIGADVTGDGIPDIPLRYEMTEESVVEFPLNFCPGVRFDWIVTKGEKKEKRTQWHVSPDPLTHPCSGYWGIAIKEWQVIKQVHYFISVEIFKHKNPCFQTYPGSARNLNKFTMTVDVDIYDEDSVKVEVLDMPPESTIKVSTKRMEDKDKYFHTLNISDPVTTRVVDVVKRLDLIKRRNRANLIYHKITSNRTYSTVSLHMRVYNKDGYFDKEQEPPK